MVGSTLLGMPVWWLLACTVALASGATLLLARRTDEYQLGRFERPLTALFVLAVVAVTIEYLLWGLYLLVVTQVAGIDAFYLAGGSVLLLLTLALFDAYRTADASRLTRRRWRTFAALFVFAGLALVVYAYLASAGWLVMFTLFADDHRADNFQNMDELFPAEEIDAGDDVWGIEYDERSLPETFTYQGDSHTTESTLEALETTGLVVLHEGALVHESYYQGYTDSSQATSWSVGKSVTSALVGIAIEEGHIDSVDDPVTDYVPELENSGYADVTIRDALAMSSGVAFDEGYDEFLTDPVALKVDAYAFNESMKHQLAAIESDREPGAYKEYVSVDTLAVGVVLEQATGESLASYAESRLWQPAGMAGDAFWNVDNDGTALSYCCLNAQLRDYARFGELFRTGGVADGEQVIPEDWVSESTAPQPPHEQAPDAVMGFEGYEYGFQWWIPEGTEGTFEAHGIYGQYIFVDTETDVVIATTATNEEFIEDDSKRLALFEAINAHISASGE